MPLSHKRDCSRIDRSFLIWTLVGLIAASMAAAVVAGALVLAMMGQN
ncbi:MAG: hypothetical protein AB7F09_10770 [Parvibaculaceae bacterium]